MLPSARFYPRTDEHWRSHIRRKLNTDEMKKLEKTVHSVVIVDGEIIGKAGLF